MKENRSNRIWNIVSAVLLGLLLLIQGRLLWQMRKLNVLPDSYFLALVGAVVLVTVFISFLLFRKRQGKWQKKRKAGKRIIGYILCAVVIAACLAGSSVIGRVQETIDAITVPERVNVVLEIYVRAEDEAQYIQDAAEYTFAISEDVPEEDTEKILDELNRVLGIEVKTSVYPGSGVLLEALLAGEADAAILDSTFLVAMEEVEGYEDILTRLRMLHELVIEKEVIPLQPPVEEATDGTEETEATEPVDLLEQPFIVYISGNDARRTELVNGGSDVNILFLVNPQSHQILMINTPRDYYITNFASGKEAKDKLSHCGLKGIENSILAMEDLYGHEIDYYAKINFSGFRTLVDAIGGVTIHSDISFQAGKYQIYAGENHLNGDQALSFARERKNLRGGDNDRGKHQMELISAMVKQLSVGNLVSNYADILKSLEGMFSTNFPAKDIGRLVQLQLKEMPDWQILTYAVTGDNGTDLCWHTGYYAYVMYPHANKVDHASQLMERFLIGEVLTEADLIPQT